MRTAFVALLLLTFASLAVQACVWAERVDAIVTTANGYPVEGARVTVTYQRNAEGVIDTAETKYTGENGVAMFNLCDSAPSFNITYDYNVSVTEPINGENKLWKEKYNETRGGLNALHFVYPYDLANVTVNVRDGLGVPVTGAVVSVIGNRVSKNKTTNDSGTAWFIAPFEPLNIRAEFGGNVLTRQISGFAWNANVTLSQTPPIRNVVVVSLKDDTGTPVANATVKIDAIGYSVENETGENGRTSFSDIPASQISLAVMLENRTRYSRSYVLAQNSTALNVSLDLRAPNVSAVKMQASNVGSYGREVYRLAFSVNASDSVSPAQELEVMVHYAVNGGEMQTVGMRYAGRSSFTASVDANRSAPFNVSYYAEATDAAGNARLGNVTNTTVRLIAPPATPTPIGAPTPKINMTGWLPEPLKSLLGPIDGILNSVTEYMWVLVFLVLVILFGTIFVFISVNAFFYMKKVKKEKPGNGR